MNVKQNDDDDDESVATQGPAGQIHMEGTGTLRRWMLLFSACRTNRELTHQ